MRIAVYSPFGTLREWRLEEIYIARALFQLGHEVDILECRGFQQSCVALSALEVPFNSEKKINVCKLCNDLKKAFCEKEKLNYLDIGNFLIEEDRSKAKKISKKGKKLSLNYIFQNIQIGKIARTHLCIKNQEIDAIKLPKTSTIELEKEIESCILMTIAAKKIWWQKSYDFLFLQNGMYPTSRCLSDVASQNKTKVISIDNGILRHKFYNSMRLSQKDYYNQLEINLKSWKQLKNKKEIPINPAKQSIKALVNGRFFIKFSKPKGQNLPKILKHDNKIKKILVILSSEDELIVAKLLNYKKRKGFKNIFKNQIEWVKALLAFADKERNSLFIIRPHPRDWPNSRTNRTEVSANGLNLLRLLKKRYRNNVYIDTPEKFNSVYDLIRNCDFVLNSWSSIGEEATGLGALVLTTFPQFCNYPPENTIIPQTKKDYFLCINKYLKEKNKIKNGNSKKMLQWITFNAAQSEIPMPNFNQLLKSLDRPKNYFLRLIKKIIPFQVYLKCINKSELLPKPKVSFISGIHKKINAPKRESL